MIVVSFGSPYLLRQFPEVPVYVCAYGSAESSQRAAVAALFGEYAVTGKLPVTLPGLYPMGHGLRIPRREMTLRAAVPRRSGSGPAAWRRWTGSSSGRARRRRSRARVVAVGKDGVLAHLRAFGRLSYDAGAPRPSPDTIYDLASLTKVVVTTTMAMILVDEGKLDLDKPVSAFLPGFRAEPRTRSRSGTC